MAEFLLTNDDGIDAMGISVLAKALAGLGQTVSIAPDANRSGVSHSITFDRPISARSREEKGFGPRIAIDGTPADAVRFGLKHYLTERPRLVVSGINAGLNVGVNVFHSGTAAAAREAVFSGVSSVALSVDFHSVPHWDTAARCAREAVELALRLLEAGAGEAGPICLNVNIPDIPYASVRGLRLTRHGRSGFMDAFHPEPDREGRFLPVGEWKLTDPHDEYDTAAVRAGYVSVTPLQIDLTDHGILEMIRGLHLA